MGGSAARARPGRRERALPAHGAAGAGDGGCAEGARAADLPQRAPLSALAEGPYLHGAACLRLPAALAGVSTVRGTVLTLRSLGAATVKYFSVPADSCCRP